MKCEFSDDEKIIGIEFEYNPSYKQFLNDLLNNLDFSKLTINVLQQEIIDDTNSCWNLSEVVDGDEFEKQISDNGNYYISYLNLAIYDNSSVIKKIKNYNDFANSDCKLYILICDGMYFEIYFKEDNMINLVLENLKKLNIHYTKKTKNNDSRTVFWI